MTTKLTVAPWKWENDSVKEKCKREGKRKRVFRFPISGSLNKQEKWEMSFPTSHFPLASMNPNTPIHAQTHRYTHPFFWVECFQSLGRHPIGAAFLYFPNFKTLQTSQLARSLAQKHSIFKKMMGWFLHPAIWYGWVRPYQVYTVWFFVN